MKLQVFVRKPEQNKTKQNKTKTPVARGSTALNSALNIAQDYSVKCNTFGYSFHARI